MRLVLTGLVVAGLLAVFVSPLFASPDGPNFSEREVPIVRTNPDTPTTFSGVHHFTTAPVKTAPGATYIPSQLIEHNDYVRQNRATQWRS